MAWLITEWIDDFEVFIAARSEVWKNFFASVFVSSFLAYGVKEEDPSKYVGMNLSIQASQQVST